MMTLEARLLTKRSLSNDVKELLWEYISSMDLDDNAKLPPEAEIAKNFGVSRVTLRRAMEDLQNEGIVSRTQGKGTFVNKIALGVRANMRYWYEYEVLIKKSGYTPSMRLLRVETIPATPYLAKALAIPEGAQVVLIEKLFSCDDQPAILCMDYMAANKLNAVPSTDFCQDNSVFTVLQHCGRSSVTMIHNQLRVSTIDELKKLTPHYDLMQTPAMLSIDSVGFDQNNQPLMCTTTYVDTAYIRFELLQPLASL